MSSEKRGSGEHMLRPVNRAVASEPRRSFAIRAQPLPNLILVAKNLGVVLANSWASHFAPYPFELYRLPAVTKGTPTCQKVGNRSIACPLSN
jgi:hypothetical protein